MSRPNLHGRSESQLLWFQRRAIVGAADSWPSLGDFTNAQAPGH